MSYDDYTESLALRLALAHDSGNEDVLARTLNEFVFDCPACTVTPVIMVLLSLLQARVNHSDHRDQLVAMMEERLIALLDADEMGVRDETENR